jgi:serine/threonine-protein kinase
MAFHCLRCNKEIDRSFKACPHCGEPITDFTREYADKPIDGKYRIVSRLGAGGMGDVYKVEHTFLGAIRVIKVVRPQIIGTGDANDRFLREARLATKVHHANVATLHDFAALPDGSHYMVWEFIDGENLAQVLRRQTVLPARQAVEIIKQALAGMEAIHRAGIVHRDISPENLMISRDADDRERVKIIDLGVAKGDDGEGTMTKTGIFVGKLRYCSPEHLGFLPDGEKIDGRADLYSLAIVLVEMLTGRPPFEATSPHQYIVHHSRDTELKSFDLTRVPQSLQPILTRALERDRNKRYSTAREFAEALDRAVIPAPIDGDATMRLTPPPDMATVRTPLPISRTEIDPAPTPPSRPPAPAPVPASRSAAPLLIGVIVFLLIVIVAGAFIALRKPVATVAQNTATTQTVAPPLPKPQTTLEVTATTEPTTTTTTIATATQPPVEIAAPVPRPRPRPIEKTEKHPPPAETAPPEPEPVPMTFPIYTEGGAAIANESAMNVARMQLRNVKEVALTGGGPLLLRELAGVLDDNGIAVVDSADVVIHFEGRLERGGRGRRRRAADATITRHGRPVLRYVMPPEEFRVGDNPAEAFGRILSDLLER